MIERLIGWIDRLSNLFAYLSAFFLIVIIVLIVSNIVLMSLFNKSIMITDEYSAYMFAAFVMFSVSYTLKEGGHIKITVLTSRLPDGVERIAKFLTTTIAFALSIYMFYFSCVMVYQAYVYQMRADTVAQTLLWIPQLCMPIGFFILSLQLISEILKVFK
ncbi:TRAP transporter small permease subunit [Hippea maritima]|uniref:Tripartite ATP-independent periplasmic transporter DctQ component n=1 Tax=Hippea maritima (strain ATCC 700847 / DSM 10411 / MH2) TaxID=760142 RepID=F2LUH7_HIPMA|nr:TRAP transporter small permease [Hippea maritima]AEA33503.1 Tripartite ATP-independent periplasmic transporter DctQ component [Hippea maritima DSM 10411]